MPKTIEVINNQIKVTETPAQVPIVTIRTLDQLYTQKTALESKLAEVNSLISSAISSGAKTKAQVDSLKINK